MVSLSLGLTKLAEHELFRREIRGNVLDVHLQHIQHLLQYYGVKNEWNIIMINIIFIYL